jgi:hypothetical protein
LDQRKKKPPRIRAARKSRRAFVRRLFDLHGTLE